FVGDVLATPHDQARSGGHLFGGWVVTRLFTEMTAWPIGGAAPYAVAHSTRQALRHGPVPSGPAFGVDERTHIVTHLQTVAEAPTGGQRKGFCSPVRPRLPGSVTIRNGAGCGVRRANSSAPGSRLRAWIC